MPDKIRISQGNHRTRGHESIHSPRDCPAAPKPREAYGVRPSPGAAGSGPPCAHNCFDADPPVDVAAPGDGRTPPPPQHVVAVVGEAQAKANAEGAVYS